MHMEATAEFAASHAALGYKLLSVAAPHKNGASQFGVLTGILGGEGRGCSSNSTRCPTASLRAPTFQVQMTSRDHAA